MFKSASLFMSDLWGTLSKALLKSRKTAQTSAPASRAWCQLFVAVNNAPVADFPLVNPHCMSEISECTARWSRRYPCTCFSRSLLKIDNKEISECTSRWSRKYSHVCAFQEVCSKLTTRTLGDSWWGPRFRNGSHLNITSSVWLNITSCEEVYLATCFRWMQVYISL